MLKLKRNQAVESVIGSKCGSGEANGAQGNGLNEEPSRSRCFDASRPTAEVLSSVLSCMVVPCRAILSATIRKNGRRGRSLLVSTRRTIATPHALMCGVSFGGSRNHGLIAPLFFMGAIHPQFLTGSRAGSLRARRFRVRGTSYTRTACPPSRKDGQIHRSVHGALAMMRTLTRSVSTAFPSIPEPVFHPVDSRHNRAVDVPKVDTFSDVADAVETLMERCADAYADAGRLPSVRRTCARNVLRSYVSELVDFCKEVEAIPARSFTIREA